MIFRAEGAGRVDGMETISLLGYGICEGRT